MGHLTNYSLNKRSEGFVKSSAVGGGSGEGGSVLGAPETAMACQEGMSKRTLSYTMSQTRAAGIDADKVWEEIKTMVRRTCQTMHPFLKNATQEQMQGSGAVGREAAVAVHILKSNVCTYLVGVVNVLLQL
jgi:hypothetical protein